MLYVSDASGSVNQAYIQFDLSSLSGVQKAKLRFFVDTSTASSNISVYAVGGSSPNSWTEDALTYNSAVASWPAATGSGPLGPPLAAYPVAGSPVNMPARYYEVDVTPAVVAAYGAASQVVSFVVANDSPAMIQFDSGEGIRPPQLIVTTAALPAIDNTYVDQTYPTHDNGGSGTTALDLKGNPGYAREAYLKFDLSAVCNLSSAKLRFYVNSATAATTLTANSIGGGTPSGWVGDGTGYLDWNDMGPYPLGSAQGSVAISTAPGYYEVDVTSLAQASLGGQLSVILTAPADGSFITFCSRFGAYPPQLILGTTSTVWAPGSQPNANGCAQIVATHPGAVYFIDNINGNTTNAGTSPSQPWNLAKYNTLVGGGTSYAGCAFLFCAGQTFLASSGNKTLVCLPGSPGAPIVYGSYDPGLTGIGQATIQAPGGPNQPLANAIAPANWTVIRDLNVVGTGIGGNYSTNVAGQWLIEAKALDVLMQNLTISNGVCGIDAVSSLYTDDSARWAIYDTTITDVGGTGIYVYGDNFTVRNCLVANWEQQGETNKWFTQGPWTASQHGIYSRARHLEVYGSEFYRYSALDTTGQAVSPRGRDNVIEGNRIHDIAECAVGYFPDTSDTDQYWGCGASAIRYNTFWNIGYSTIRGGCIFYGSSNGGVMNEHWVAYNNTCYGLGNVGATTAFLWNNLQNGATDRNNAITGLFAYSSHGPAAGSYVHDHNSVGSPDTLGIPTPPALGSASLEWVPEPANGSPLLGAGIADVDAGFTILYPTPPDIGSY